MVQSQITVLFTLAMFGTDWNAGICLPYAFSKAKRCLQTRIYMIF